MNLKELIIQKLKNPNDIKHYEELYQNYKISKLQFKEFFIKNSLNYSNELLILLIINNLGYFYHLPRERINKELINFIFFPNEKEIIKYKIGHFKYDEKVDRFFSSESIRYKYHCLNLQDLKMIGFDFLIKLFSIYPELFFNGSKYSNNKEKNKYYFLKNSGNLEIYKSILNDPLNIRYIPKKYLNLELQNFAIQQYLKLKKDKYIYHSFPLSKISNEVLTEVIGEKLLNCNVYNIQEYSKRKIISEKLAIYFCKLAKEKIKNEGQEYNLRLKRFLPKKYRIYFKKK